jgi:hypothetical protein
MSNAHNDNDTAVKPRAPAKADGKGLWMLVTFCLALVLLIVFNMK